MSIISKLSGKELYWSIISGGKKLIEHQEEINKINVFPVPDGDTGANLAATATSIIYHAKEDISINKVAISIGDAALDGARGNSGVILAQFLYGLGVELKDTVELNTQKFATIVKKASDYVYQALPNPQEGTIITVIREWADFIHSKQHEFSDFGTLFEKAEVIAHKALQRTTEQLEVLRIAKVVDAGAKGFVLFIQGIKETILNKAFNKEDHDLDHLLMDSYELPMAEAESLTEESLHNRYCTETCLIGNDISRDTILQILNEDADSIVIAGSDQKLRLHFHTNHPANMFDKLRKFGSFTFQKVEDMRLQYNVTHHRKSSIAFVIDSGTSLDPQFMEENQIHFVPAIIEINGVSYLDGRTMDIDLLQKHIKEDAKITTSQASPKSYADLFGYLSNYYDSIIVLSMAATLSGTFNSACQGRDLIQSKKDIKIDIIDSQNLSAGSGAIAHFIIQDVNQGLSHETIIQKAKTYCNSTRNFMNFHTIDHLIRSGRLGAFKGGIIKALNLAPILEIKDGKPIITGKAFGFQKALQKTITNIKKSIVNRKVKGYTFAHSYVDEKSKTYLLKQLENIFGTPPMNNIIVQACITNHVGIGAINIGVIYDY